MKKNIKGKLTAFVLLLGLAVIGAMRFTAAGALDSDAVTVDYVNETVTVETDTDEVIYFTEVYNKDVAKWDACEVREGKASFDISWIASNKTVRLYICGDVNKEVLSVDIIWEEDFSVEFTGSLLSTDITEAEEWKQVYADYENFSEDTGYFLFALEENGRDMSYFELENIQWRKGDDGVWRDYDELDLREMNIRGIGLEFRVVADNNGPARASSTAKISVSKLMSAPVILVNPNTMTLGIKNGMEFSFDKENWIMVPEYNKKFGEEEYMIEEDVREAAIEKIYTNKRLTTLIMQEVLKTQDAGFTMNTPMNRDNLEDFNANGQVFELTDEGVVLYVREIGTDRKAASKIAEVIIPYAPENMAIAEEGALEFSYGESKTNTGGIVVENVSDYKYQVGVITPEEWAKIKDSQDDINLANMKWTSIKAGKMLKISNKKVPKGSYLVYRIAAEDGQLPSTYRIYGPMEYNELTYAGIAPGKRAAGETIEAVVSTNFVKKNDGTYDGLTFQWQRCANIKAETPEWTDIPGATKPTYELTNDDSTQYVRVVVTNRVTVGITTKEIIMATDPEGPVAYVTPKDENKADGN
ncbi:MAG: hypothetical protein IJ029_06880 [Lachnospiraceae bacterium]|nr:hypothetical protein [Lachnospiraceae bacterium]